METPSMKIAQQELLKREEILAMAHEAKLMIVDGGISYMNDMATDKELLAFARLIEARRAAKDELSNA